VDGGQRVVVRDRHLYADGEAHEEIDGGDLDECHHDPDRVRHARLLG